MRFQLSLPLPKVIVVLRLLGARQTVALRLGHDLQGLAMLLHLGNLSSEMHRVLFLRVTDLFDSCLHRCEAHVKLFRVQRMRCGTGRAGRCVVQIPLDRAHTLSELLTRLPVAS